MELDPVKVQQEINILQIQIQDALTKYGEKHPRVMALKANLENYRLMVENQERKQGWVPMFNGKDLTGWSQKNGTAKYEVMDGTIKGTTTINSPNSFLCSEKNYGDFELKFDVKVHDELNSGVQIRSRENEKQGGRVFGPQVEIESSGDKGAEAGYVYGEATGRGWLTPKERLIPHKKFKDGNWNSYRILAQGPRIQTWINGQPVEDLTDQPIFKSHPNGFIGLQVHGVGKRGPFTVQWRNIKIREISKKADNK